MINIGACQELNYIGCYKLEVCINCSMGEAYNGETLYDFNYHTLYLQPDKVEQYVEKIFLMQESALIFSNVQINTEQPDIPFKQKIIKEFNLTCEKFQIENFNLFYVNEHSALLHCEYLPRVELVDIKEQFRKIRREAKTEKDRKRERINLFNSYAEKIALFHTIDLATNFKPIRKI